MIEQNKNLQNTINMYIYSLEKSNFGWRNVGALPQICRSFQTLAQRWANGDIHTVKTPTIIQRWANSNMQTATILTIIQRWPNGTLLAGWWMACNKVIIVTISGGFNNTANNILNSTPGFLYTKYIKYIKYR